VRKENERENSLNQNMKLRLRPNSETKIYIWKKVIPIVIFQSLSYENEDFAYISDRFMIKFTETAYELRLNLELGKSKFQ
jgi:hypothetical protein